MNLVIEMLEGSGYGHIHQAGCRQVGDPEAIGTSSTKAEVCCLAAAVTGGVPTTTASTPAARR